MAWARENSINSRELCAGASVTGSAKAVSSGIAVGGSVGGASGAWVGACEQAGPWQGFGGLGGWRGRARSPLPKTWSPQAARNSPGARKRQAAAARATSTPRRWPRPERRGWLDTLAYPEPKAAMGRKVIRTRARHEMQALIPRPV